jgi:hypothetical protein
VFRKGSNSAAFVAWVIRARPTIEVSLLVQPSVGPDQLPLELTHIRRLHKAAKPLPAPIHGNKAFHLFNQHK